MSATNEILGTDLAARVSRLSQDLESPADLWPSIAAGIAHEHASLDALALKLERDVEPRVDLWPGIEAQLARASPTSAPRHWLHSASWLDAAASVAAVAILVGLVSSAVMTSNRAPNTDASRVAADSEELWALPRTAGTAARGTVLGETIEAMRIELAAVQGERRAIEQSLDQDTDNLALHALWLQVYQTELELAGQAERLIETYGGA
jgi:hypothetical protein